MPKRKRRSKKRTYSEYSDGNAETLETYDPHARRQYFPSVLSIQDRVEFEATFDFSTLELGETDKAIYLTNPHLRQVFANKTPLMQDKFTEPSRYIHSQTPATPYRRRTGEYKTVEHWGQRKLMIMEMEFLLHVTKNSTEQIHVIYVGAGPGHHLNQLACLFPTVVFHLFDPVPFACMPTDRVHLYQELFTDELAETWATKVQGKCSAFISDIRVNFAIGLPLNEVDDLVLADMESQRRWAVKLQCDWSLLKFRLPYSSGTTDYLAGRLFFQPWAGRTSSETRLLVSKAELSTTESYDNDHYANQLFHFNTVSRTTFYDSEPYCSYGEGIDHCYDCSCELYVLQQYVLRHPSWEIPQLSNLLSATCSFNGRTLNIVD